MASYQEIIAHIEGLADSKIAEHSQRFFKTGNGEYGYGDKFSWHPKENALPITL